MKSLDSMVEDHNNKTPTLLLLVTLKLEILFGPIRSAVLRRLSDSNIPYNKQLKTCNVMKDTAIVSLLSPRLVYKSGFSRILGTTN
jgi:hypothetical protein